MNDANIDNMKSLADICKKLIQQNNGYIYALYNSNITLIYYFLRAFLFYQPIDLLLLDFSDYVHNLFPYRDQPPHQQFF